jgi:hypothetical protein
MPQNSAPHTYRVVIRRKDQRWALFDGGSVPPPFDEDDPIAIDTTSPVIGKDKGTCKAQGM